jgi:hypothetical protein
MELRGEVLLSVPVSDTEEGASLGTDSYASTA